MIDNTTFFLGEGPSAESLRRALAEVCGVALGGLLLAPAADYEWESPEHYDDKTLLQWHEYQRGDLRLEVEVLLGGARLASTREPDVWEALSKKLGVAVLVPNDEPPDSVLYLPDGTNERATFDFPEDYDEQGPVRRV